jgi:threonine dehydratase
MIPDEWLQQARDGSSPYFQPTHVIADQEDRTYHKLEEHRQTDSFKLRGALNKVLSGKMDTTPSIVVISGGNITTSLHQQVIGKYREDYLEKKR